jgi:cell division septum initiation protein DivIVA
VGVGPMIQEVLGYVKRLVFLLTDTQQNKADIKELTRKVQRLSDRVQKLTYELDGMKETERLEREKLRLQLEVALAQFERRLPRP